MAQVMSKTKAATTKTKPSKATEPETKKSSAGTTEKAGGGSAAPETEPKPSRKAPKARSKSAATSTKRSAATARASATTKKKAAPVPSPKATAQRASKSATASQPKNGDTLSKTHARLSRKILDEREKLVRQAEELEAEQQALAADPDAAEMSGDIESGDCVASREREVDLKLSAHIQEMIAQIDRATERLNAGTYGECARCHARIPAARLEALPYAELCVSCQEKHERLYY